MIESDKQLLPFNEKDYISLRHLVVKGSDREIGRDLAELARSDYAVRMDKYEDPVYARARGDYFEALWPGMAERMRGVAEAFGVDYDTTDLDLSLLEYDLGGGGCSAVVMPASRSASGHPMVARNYDYFTATNSQIMGTPPQSDELPVNKRSYALETRPDDGHAFLGLGGNDLLNPWLDGINDAGLWVNCLNDPGAPGSPFIPWGAARDSGLSQNQLPAMLLATCATVGEAKRALLPHKVFAPVSGFHFLIADAEGAATVFEIDGETGQFFFNDAVPDEPLVVSNYPIHKYPTPDTFPSVDPAAEHNPFNRAYIINDGIAKHDGKWTREDLQALLDSVTCAFVDQKLAQVNDASCTERTIWNLIADLATKEVVGRFYLGDSGPIEGTNHMGIRWSEPITFALGQ